MAKLHAHTYKPLWSVFKETQEDDGIFMEFITLRSDRKLLWRWTRYNTIGRMTTRQKWIIRGRLKTGISPEEALTTYQLNGWRILTDAQAIG